MSLKEKTKNEIKKKFKKIVLKIIKPFIPFIIVIFLIVLAVCTVVDSIFTTEDDMKMAEKLSSEDYEAQYAEWLKEKETSPNTIANDTTRLVPTRNVYLAHTWIFNYNITFRYESTSNHQSL